MKVKSPDRNERLARALRENLKRRKARERAVAETTGPNPPEASQKRPNAARKAD